MKKKILFSTLFALTASLLVGIGVSTNNQTNAEQVSNADELNNLIDRFYNNGHYVKNTEIYLTDDAVNELNEHSGFHQSTERVRTTYYTPEALWMSRGEGMGYSYYGTGENGVLTNGSATSPLVEPENIHTAATKDSLKWHNDAENGMEGYYITLKDINPEVGQEWDLNNGIYSCTNDAVIEWFKAFYAPCYVGSDDEEVKNYVVLNKVEIQQIGTELELRLYSNSESIGILSSNDGLFAKASVHYFTIDNSYVEIVNDRVIYTVTGESYGLNESSYIVDVQETANSWVTKDLENQNVSISNNRYTITSDVTDQITYDIAYLSHLKVNSFSYDIVNIKNHSNSLVTRNVDNGLCLQNYAVETRDVFNNGINYYQVLIRSKYFVQECGETIYFNSRSRILNFTNLNGTSETLTLYVTKIESNNTDNNDYAQGYYVYKDSNGNSSLYQFKYNLDGWTSIFDSSSFNEGLTDSFNDSNGYTVSVNNITFKDTNDSWRTPILGW